MAQIRHFKDSKTSRKPGPTETKECGPDTLKKCVSTSDDSTHNIPNSLLRSRSSPAGNTPLPSPLRRKGRMEIEQICHRYSTVFGESDKRCGSCNHSRQPIGCARQIDTQDSSSVHPPSLTIFHTSALDPITHDLGGTSVSSTSTKEPSHLALPVVTEEHAPNYTQPYFPNETYLSTNDDPFMGASQDIASWDKGVLDDSELTRDVTLSYGSTLDVNQTSHMLPVDYVSPHQIKMFTGGADYATDTLPRQADLPHSGIHSETAPLESQSKKPFLTKTLSSMISQSKSARRSCSRSLHSDISSLVNRLSKHSLGEREGIKDVLGRFSSSMLSSRSTSVRILKKDQSRTQQPLLLRPSNASPLDGLDLPGDFILSNINTFGVRHVACGFGGARPQEFQPYFCEGCFQRLLPQSEHKQFSVCSCCHRS